MDLELRILKVEFMNVSLPECTYHLVPTFDLGMFLLFVHEFQYQDADCLSGRDAITLLF